jgi:hypothetical protein
MMKKITISLPDWIVKEIIGKTDNVSGRIMELIIKGHIKEIKHKM